LKAGVVVLKRESVLCALAFLFAMSGAVGVFAQAPTEGAVWNLRQWECRVDAGGFSVISKESMTVFAPRGDQYAHVSLSESDHVKIGDVHAKVLNAGGVIRELHKKDLQKDCGYGQYVLYDDNCFYYGDLRGPGYPYTVEIEYKLQAQSLFYWRSVAVQDDIPVTKASYRLDIPNEVGFDYRLYGATIQPTVAERGTRTLYEWSFDSLPALEDWEYLPPGYNEPITLAFAPRRLELESYELRENSWPGICEWYVGLYADRLDDAGTGRMQGEDDRAVAARIYGEVIGSVRYVAVEIGLGGWQPHKASLTAQRGYGDCKDMATLLVSRLRAAGVESHPIHIKAKPDAPLDPQFPRIDFNHVIAVALIGGDTVWMDATCNTCPFGELPWSDENVDVLVGGEAGGVVRRTAAPSARDNRAERNFTITLQPNGSATIDATLSITGNHAISIRNRYPTLDAEERKHFVADLLPGADKKFKVDDFSVTGLDGLDAPVTIRLTAATVKPFTRIKGTSYVTPFLCHDLSAVERANLTDRPFPLNLFYADECADRIVVRWDSTSVVELLSVPDDDSLTSEVARFSLKTEGFPDSVVINLYKSHRADIVPVERFDEFVVFRDRLKDIYKETIRAVISPRP